MIKRFTAWLTASCYSFHNEINFSFSLFFLFLLKLLFYFIGGGCKDRGQIWREREWMGWTCMTWKRKRINKKSFKKYSKIPLTLLMAAPWGYLHGANYPESPGRQQKLSKVNSSIGKMLLPLWLPQNRNLVESKVVVYKQQGS